MHPKHPLLSGAHQHQTRLERRNEEPATLADEWRRIFVLQVHLLAGLAAGRRPERGGQGQVFADLQVQVSRVPPAGILPDRADALTARHPFAGSNVHLREVRVDRAHHTPLVVLVDEVVHQHHAPPRIFEHSGSHDAAAGHGVDRLAKIGIASACPIPVVAGVNPQRIVLPVLSGHPPAAVRKSAAEIDVGALCIRVAHWKVEAVCGGDIAREVFSEDVR